MSSLAAILLEAGESVSGCDLATNASTDLLVSKGARVLQGHSTEHLAGATRLVVTGPAMRSGEVARARELGLPVLRRAEMLGRLMDDRKGVAVAGTHGKTTTTSLLASILLAGRVDPSVLIGGVPAGWELGGRFGHGEWFLAEADEYDRSFHLMHPDLAIVTSIEMDHPDIYADLQDVKDSFETFLRGMRARGTLLVHLGDAVAMEVARRAAAASGTALLTYGLTSDADWYAKVESGSSRFALHGPGETLSDLRAPLPGDHNLCNAVAAAAAARLIGVSNNAVREGLEAFRGVGRRWEVKGESQGVSWWTTMRTIPARWRRRCGTRDYSTRSVSCGSRFNRTPTAGPVSCCTSSRTRCGSLTGRTCWMCMRRARLRTRRCLARGWRASCQGRCMPEV